MEWLTVAALAGDEPAVAVITATVSCCFIWLWADAGKIVRSIARSVRTRRRARGRSMKKVLPFPTSLWTKKRLQRAHSPDFCRVVMICLQFIRPKPKPLFCLMSLPMALVLPMLEAS